MPRPVVTAGACLLVAGAHACPAGLHQSDWFTSAVDARTCGCTCGAPTGGNCNSLLISVSEGCSGALDGYLTNNGGNRMCLATPTTAPGLEITSTPQPPTCQATAQFNGVLSTSGPQTLCCL